MFEAIYESIPAQSYFFLLLRSIRFKGDLENVFQNTSFLQTDFRDHRDQ